MATANFPNPDCVVMTSNRSSKNVVYGKVVWQNFAKSEFLCGWRWWFYTKVLKNAVYFLDTTTAPPNRRRCLLPPILLISLVGGFPSKRSLSSFTHILAYFNAVTIPACHNFLHCRISQWKSQDSLACCVGLGVDKLIWMAQLQTPSRNTVLTLSLPKMINFKFLLHPHKKYYITQYGELGFL